MDGGKRVFHALDGLRGLAALAVVERHKADFFTGAPMPAGYLAVDLFFVLSGFVIAHAYGARLAQGMPVSAFMTARVIRLAPLYLLATAFGAALFAALMLAKPEDAAGLTWPAWFGSLTTAAFMLPTPEAWSLAPDRLFPLNDPAWSLFFEMAINLAFALFILELSNRMLLILSGAGLAGLAMAAVAHGGIDIGFDWRTFLAGFPRVTFGFFAGVLVHRLWVARGSAVWAKGRAANFGGWGLACVMLAAMAAPVGDAWRPTFEIAAVALLFPALVYAGASLAPSGLSLKAFTVLGAASYGIYVFHLPAARAFGQFMAMAGFDPAAHAPFTGIIFALMLFAGALILDRWFDRPIRRWLTGRVERASDRVRPAFPTARADWRPDATR
jgi:peptidoglycan/LPS O-acetylase OafA/YrhL